MLNVTVTNPGPEFTRTMEEFLRRSKRTQRDGSNARMLDVEIKAYQNTKVANRAAIEARLGVQRVFGKQTKSGFTRFKKAGLAVNKSFSLAYMIVQKRFHDRAGVYLPEKVAEADAKRMVAAIGRSVGFVRSGFIAGMKVLNRVVKGGKLPAAGSEVRGRPKGYAYPATTDDNPTVEIGNTTKVAAPIAGPALELAISQSTAWMESKMREDAEKVAATMAGGTVG